MIFFGSESPVSVVSYVLAAYTLTVLCLRVPYLIKIFKEFKKSNKYFLRWKSDDRLRVNVSLYGSLIWNIAYAIFQLWLGIYHNTFWFCSLGAYYFCLAFMRVFLAHHTSLHKRRERMREELLKYRACVAVFLVMNLALSLMIFFMVYWNRTFEHHEITTIAMAAYTFTSFTFAIINIIKYRKYQSPVYSASKAISLAAACVSMLTLEATMLTTWGGNEDIAFRRTMLALTGIAISLFIIAMSIYMIVQSTKKLKEYNTKKYKESSDGEQK